MPLIGASGLDDTGWRQLLPPSLLHQVEARVARCAGTPLIRVARILGAAVGCGICLPAGDDTGELLILVTAAPMRRRGIGRQVLAAIEDGARHEGIVMLSAGWTSGLEDAGAPGTFFTHNGWTIPERTGIDMRMEAAHGASFLAGLANRLPPCPHRFVAWDSLGSGQRAALQSAIAAGGDIVPPGLDPFELERQGAQDISFAIVTADGRVLGWHIAGWTAPDRAWVLASYGLPEVLGGSCFIRLWITFFERAVRRGAHIQCGWDTHVSSLPMTRFLLRRKVSARPTTQGRWSATRQLPARSCQL